MSLQETSFVTVEWWTPPEVFIALGETFDLDPAAPPGGVPWLPTRRFYSLPEEDGRSLPWEGFVWCNPPYGPFLARFVGRFLDHADGILLIPARTDNHSVQRVLAECDSLLFLRRRIQYIGRAGAGASGPTFPSMLAACGARGVAALDRTTLEGIRIKRDSAR